MNDLKTTPPLRVHVIGRAKDRQRERGKILIILGFNYSKTVIPMRLSSHY